ncbi:MAG: glutathione synthase [Catalinimonas sp.]
MKKIGILFGREDQFPWAFVERVNQKAAKDNDGEPIKAEPVHISMVQQAQPTDYAVIIDRISQDVPFYRAFLKNAAATGTAVINNPFWWSADEKFFNNVLAEQVGVAVPKTVLLPSKDHPEDTGPQSFRNLAYPLAWEKIFDYIGFPAFMKPYAGGGWKHVYKVNNRDELFRAYHQTGRLVMMLQEAIDFTEYFRCYYLGGKVHAMPYEPRNPFHERYLRGATVSDEMRARVHSDVTKLCTALGYDFNTVELAVRDGVPYAIDFCNPAPDADQFSVGPDNYEWVVENAAEMAIERARAQRPGENNLTWGLFVQRAQAGRSVAASDLTPNFLQVAAERASHLWESLTNRNGAEEAPADDLMGKPLPAEAETPAEHAQSFSKPKPAADAPPAEEKKPAKTGAVSKKGAPKVTVKKEDKPKPAAASAKKTAAKKASSKKPSAKAPTAKTSAKKNTTTRGKSSE